MNKLKTKLFYGAWVLALSLVALTTAAYAWMSIANTIRISDLELNVVTENAMEIALDENGQPGTWTTVLSLGELLDPDTALRPVTWSAQQDKFLTVQYGLDGRADGLTDVPEMISIDRANPDSSAAEAEETEESGYIIALDLWVRAGASQARVVLSEPDESSEGVLGAGTWVVGEPTWNAGSLRHDNGGKGAEQVVRMGFRTYDEEYEKGGFVLYEPNAEANTPTPSVDGGNLEGAGRLIQQEATVWKEQSPVLRDNVDYEMGQFLSEDVSLFSIRSDTPRRFTLYIWLEGQDAQCTNAISQGKLLANVQFSALLGGERENIYRPEGG